MRRRYAFPFLTLSDASIKATPWSVSLNGGDWSSAGDYLPDWDSASSVGIRREINLDDTLAADDLGLDAHEVRLALTIRIGTGSGRLPRRILECHYRELDPQTCEEQLHFEISGNLLSQILDVQTHIVLSRETKGGGPLSPSRFADRLWSDSLRIRLEGEEPRFPVEIVDMHSLLGDVIESSSPWYLQWSPRDWDRDFYGATRLYLNGDQAAFVQRVQQFDGPTLQALLADIMSQICSRLLMDPEADAILSTAEPGSLGAQAASWLQSLWPDKDATFLRSVLGSYPGKFRAAFLSLAELYET